MTNDLTLETRLPIREATDRNPANPELINLPHQQAAERHAFCQTWCFKQLPFRGEVKGSHRVPSEAQRRPGRKSKEHIISFLSLDRHYSGPRRLYLRVPVTCGRAYTSMAAKAHSLKRLRRRIEGEQKSVSEYQKSILA